MQIVSNGDNLHEMSNPVSWENNKKKIINISSADLAQRVLKVNFISEMCAWDNHYCWPGTCSDDLVKNCQCSAGFVKIASAYETTCQCMYFQYPTEGES